MVGYDFIFKFSEGRDVSEEDLVRIYYCSVLSSIASKKRRSGERGQFGDKYMFFPKVRLMDKYLEEGVSNFFDRSEVCNEGLTRGDFIRFVERLEEEEYNKGESILEL